MPNDRNGVFRVGVTRDVRRPDGTFRFAPFDLAPLGRAGISWQFLEDDALTPDSLADVDGTGSASTSSTSGPAPRTPSP
jgi:hypothetical protein